jgi:hypothetical protein
LTAIYPRCARPVVAIANEMAFARHEQRLMPFLKAKQQTARKFASAFAPGTSFGIAFRDLITRLLRVPLVADWAIGRDLREDIVLPHYPFLQQ